MPDSLAGILSIRANASLSAIQFAMSDRECRLPSLRLFFSTQTWPHEIIGFGCAKLRPANFCVLRLKCEAGSGRNYRKQRAERCRGSGSHGMLQVRLRRCSAL